MNSKSETDEASRGSEASSSNNNPTPDRSNRQPSCLDADSDSNNPHIMKRAAARQLIERYFYQLLDGCGSPNCDNKYCASSGEARNLTPNEAAAEAIKLFYKEAQLCDTLPNKVPRTEAGTCGSSASATSTQDLNTRAKLRELHKPITGASSMLPTGKVIEKAVISHFKTKESDCQVPRNVSPLNEEILQNICDLCLEENTAEYLIGVLGVTFTQPSVLARCFPRKIEDPNTNKKGKKSDKESTSNDPDKDIDSVMGPGLDIASCRRAFQYFSKLPSEYYSTALVLTLNQLAENLIKDLKVTKRLSIEDIVNCLVIAFELPELSCGDYLEVSLPALCQVVEYLPIKGKARLARVWAEHCKESLRKILENLQQLITLRVISTNYSRHYQLQDDETVTLATKFMKILYYANMLAGVMEPNTNREDPIVLPNHSDPLGDALDHLYPLTTFKHTKTQEDPLAIVLDINVLDCRKPYLPFEEFYNEPLSDTIEMDIDLANCKSDFGSVQKFSFLNYPFILTTATKTLGLYYENRIRMYSERRVSMLHAVVGASTPMPFLRLKVRRSHIIEDALVELEMIAMERPFDLKKQLVVEFEGEQGVDEGGVSKEFFQLVVEQIFNVDYGMFTVMHDTFNVWFNPNSFETEAQFTLIGIVLGLAIYNNIILPVNFPMVVYRKLLGKRGSFEDLADWNATLYKSLKHMLEYEGSDLEETYLQTFRICYKDVFGSNIFHDLKPDGNEIFVTQDNKKEFVDMYADFFLNKSIETQFKAFRRGFVMVTDVSPVSTLFRPEEVEMLVCGSKNFDFMELEKSTEYDAGYTAESQIIKDFWSIVHNLTIQDKRKLLQFTTGSDRVPVGGLSHLKLVIARNGPDCDRLPAAHTCFNVLLLPEYDSKEKLEDRLLKAISYSKGFGLL